MFVNNIRCSVSLAYRQIYEMIVFDLAAHSPIRCVDLEAPSNALCLKSAENMSCTALWDTVQGLSNL